MRGYGYILTISTTIGALALIFDHIGFIFCGALWLLYLFYERRISKGILIGSLFLMTFFYFHIPNIHLTQININNPEEETEFIGKVSTYPRSTSNRIEFTLKNEDVRILAVYFFHPHEEKYLVKTIQYGALCRIKGRIQIPERNRNPGEFDYQKYLRTKGITHQIIPQSLDDIQCTGKSLFHSLFQLRSYLLHWTEKNFQKETSIWMKALIFGDPTEIDRETIELFQRWGLSHLLAISGLHVGLFVSTIYFLFVKLNVWTKERTQSFLLIFIPIYAFLAGGEPSVIRASSMFFLWLIFSKLKIRWPPIDRLSVIYILLLLIDPYLIYHIGFQFSFIITFSLLMSQKLISSVQSNFFKGLMISFVSQMVILPLQVNYFFIFQPLSILLNTIIVPYFSLFVIPFLLILFLLSIIFPFPMFDFIFQKIHLFVLLFLEKLDQRIAIFFVIGNFPWIGTVIYYSLLLFMLIALEKKKLEKSFLYALLLVFVITILFHRDEFLPKGNITMLDVGQAEMFVIELPYRQGVFLMDVGAELTFPDFEQNDRVYRRVIKPYLYSRGITSIDAIFISHEDLDHIGSLPYILEDFQVGHILISKYTKIDQQEKRDWQEKGVQWIEVEANQQITIRGQTFHILSPKNDKLSPNDNSLVFYTTFGNKNWLFTGDISQVVERELLKEFPNLSVDVLKVAHHGSETSTDETFIKQLKPSYVFISAGVKNSFGHPHPAVIERIEENGSVIFRTDLHGAVRYTFDQRGGTFHQHLPYVIDR